MLQRKTIGKMALVADAAVGDALAHGSTGMRARPRAEVGMVAAVILGGVPNIATNWRGLLRAEGYSLDLRSVFCHGAPLVKYTKALGSTQCELADLLIVADTKTRTGIVRRATLIQAKMAARAQRVEMGGASSVRQLYLYQQWPSFSF